MAGVTLSLYPDPASWTTDSNGLARIPLGQPTAGPQLLVAKKDGDLIRVHGLERLLARLAEFLRGFRRWRDADRR